MTKLFIEKIKNSPLGDGTNGSAQYIFFSRVDDTIDGGSDYSCDYFYSGLDDILERVSCDLGETGEYGKILGDFEFSMRIRITLRSMLETDYYRKISKAALEHIHETTNDYPEYKLAFLKLLAELALEPDDKLKAFFKSCDCMYEQVIAGDNFYSFGLYQKGTWDINLGSEKYFPDRVRLLEHMLSNHPGDYGLIIGDDDIANFIKNRGDKAFNAIEEEKTKTTLFKLIVNNAIRNKWILPKTALALSERRRQTNETPIKAI